MAFIANSDTRYLENPILGIRDTIGAHFSHAPQRGYLERTWNKPESKTITSTTTRRIDNYNNLLSLESSFGSHSPPTDASSLIPPLHQRYPSINTNFGHSREVKSDPSVTSPSTPASASRQLDVLGQYGGSTPLLASPSLPTPSTDKSNFLVLTPDQGMQPELQLLDPPDQWAENTSPYLAPHAEHTSPYLAPPAESGLTPGFGGVRISRYDEPTFQMAGPVKRIQQSSVLLGSNPGSESSQATDLDPLDMDDKLADFGHVPGQVSGAGLANGLGDEGYHIRIVSPQTQSIPITVSLDNSGSWNPASMLSPLSALQALPMSSGEFYGLSDEHYHDTFMGVAIPPGSWNQLFPHSQAVSPTPSNVSSVHDSRSSPQIFPESDIVAPEPKFRESNSQPTRFRNCDNDVTNSARSALEAVRSGQPHSIVNFKGVSERTLAAAEANRKREAKFHCTICGNCQTSKQNLDNHILSRHMQLKRFECPVSGCSAKYGHARGVNRHLDSKHPGYRQSGAKGKRSKVV